MYVDDVGEEGDCWLDGEFLMITIMSMTVVYNIFIVGILFFVFNLKSLILIYIYIFE